MLNKTLFYKCYKLNLEDNFFPKQKVKLIKKKNIKIT